MEIQAKTILLSVTLTLTLLHNNRRLKINLGLNPETAHMA